MLASARGRTVEIEWSTERGAGEFALIHPDNSEYWLGAADTPGAAIELCRSIGVIPGAVTFEEGGDA